MLSFKLRHEAVKLLETFEKASSFFSMLEAINSSFPAIDNYLIQIGEGGTIANNAMSQLRSHLLQLRNIVSQVNIREFYASLEEFQKNLHFAKESGLDDLNIIDGISKNIDIFAEKYEVFIGAYTPQSASPVITEARKLTSLLNGFKTALLFFESNLEEHYYEIENHKELSLLLPSTMSLNQFAIKLISIDTIYTELCSLLDISMSEYPLVISKIESGSLWAKVFGNSKIIELMVGFLNASASYVYHNYTKEGKLLAIPKKLDVIESVLEFTSKLERAGIDTSTTKEHISKAAISIVKELNTLLDGQAEITVNNTTHSIGEEVQKQLLEVGSPLKIEHLIEENL
ncbi:MAG: hypothetical protein WCS55_03935 [Sulfuricurvum sp.]|uniref:hypothetical protein n=1 Tax=Sulfuricurvum sp. TaxID=2025608 RepID=UPI0035674AB1